MKEVWIVDEDKYNDFSYWSTKEKAIERMKHIILEDPNYGCEIHPELFQEDDNLISYAYGDWLFARKVVLDNPQFLNTKKGD